MKMKNRAHRAGIAAVALTSALVLVPVLTFAAANVQRLTANGLTATDPQIVAKLRALFAAHGRRAVAGPRPTITFLTVTPRVQPLHVVSTIPIRTPAAPAATAAPVSSAPAITSVSSGYFQHADSNGLTISGANLGVTPAAAVTASNCPAANPTLYSSDPGDWYYKFPYFVPTEEPAHLTVSGPAYSLPAVISLDPTLNVQQQITVPIGDVAPFFAGDALSEGASTYATTVASHASTNPADPTVTGTDTLGYGVSVVNGWQVTAQIGNIHSYMDSPSESSASDAYRSASIVQQPSNGRLETKVAWSFEGGESISYSITWTFIHGAYGARITTTQPKQTPCTDEQ